MSTEDIDLFADAQQGVQISDQSLGTIADLSKKLMKARARLAELEESVSRGKEYIRQLEERDIPDAMAAIGMSSFKLDTGEVIEVENLVRGSIPEKHKDEAFSWLRAHNHGDLIKQDVVVKFGRNEDQKAQEVIKTLESLGCRPTAKETVHHGTLSAWAKEQVAKGVDLPAEILGLYIGRRAKVKA